ncbi:DUF3043 domain-containing protein [Actinomyces viscosus]|uniref:Protein of uncharacterized function (DUF3043) n=1 Tax=Actinomyces viscosus TaxID=1656 RepID=A0A448PJF0_ACTVI|nr:DUF3043 domain-containing protein [Actinomyces viscosus]TFH52262.1 DUF3043 domain-containing protein [Actinomyces viscosus]VEI15067.1 Protein of uncharacterised function (DUF3043) [Actinomyces viscosus]
MSLFKKRSQTPDPEPAAEPAPKPGGKGRPTPRRKDQQAKNLHPVVPKDRQAAKREARAARDEAWRRQSEAMVTGDEKYLPSREKGPVKRYIRDYVDARFSLGEFFMPLIFVLLILSFGLSRLLPQYPLVSFYTVLAMNGYLLLAIADSVWAWSRLRRRLYKKFGEERVKDEGTIFFYIMSRCFMLRRFRRPAALASRGQYPS